MRQLLLYYTLMADEARFGIQDLASLGGVTRRTVRYYLQEGLLPPPLGLGRGDHYTQAHLDALLRIKALQEQGLTIAQVRQSLAGPRPPVPVAAPPARQTWIRLNLAPGIELHISTARRLPPPSRLAELAAWCRDHFAPMEDPQS